MMDEKREFSRAPFGLDILYVDDIYVFKALGENISKGGILLSMLPHIPSESTIHLMASVPRMEQLHLISIDHMKSLIRENLEFDVIRLKGVGRRTEYLNSSVDEVFDQKLAVQFTDVPPTVVSKIGKYVENMAANILFLLQMLDGVGKDEEKMWRLKQVAMYLGYKFSSINELRHLILKDYRNFEIG